MEEKSINSGTTFHVRKSQDMKFNFLQQAYIQKTKVPLKKVDFFDKVLEMIEREIESMAQKQVVDGKVKSVPVPPENMVGIDGGMMG